MSPERPQTGVHREEHRRHNLRPIVLPFAHQIISVVRQGILSHLCSVEDAFKLR